MPARDLREKWSGRADLKCRTARLLTPRTKNLFAGIGLRLPPLAGFSPEPAEADSKIGMLRGSAAPKEIANTRWAASAKFNGRDGQI